LVVVDTSVWVDLLRGRETAQTVRCESMIRDGAPVALTDVVLMELLEGVQDDRGAAQLEHRLREFPVLRLAQLADFSLAAELSRRARRAGIRLRSKIDYLIAAPCVRTGAPILHADSDFDRLASCTPLRVFV
jgi:predicted nucleic acid-binding protein